ncbi:exported hypothetical protein [uncultured delta proteobacterium]|uniref:Uncharacterized protein n=1 Tax=uncultured delta proteobacterium TaxID=34034 RepID=A0A212JDR9_9DELT|nr:exported hypothetical protein [uncultured delta proteobacterium]
MHADNTRLPLFPASGPAHTLARILALAVACLCLFGCAAAFNGISGSTLVRTDYPRLTVGANPPLILQGYGRQWVSLPTDYLGLEPSGIMDFAVYGDEGGNGSGEGAITRHAHAFVVTPSDDRRWYFRPESNKPFGGLALGRKDIGGYSWTVQVLRVDGEKDWFSAMWRASGRETPPLWLARRFSATPDRAVRVVAEYREPWPECLDPEAADLVFARKECLEGFFARSDAAFSLDMHAPEMLEAPSAPSMLAKPAFSPDMKKLAGELMEVDFFRGWR